MHPMLSSFVARCALASLAAVPLTAQVPDGWMVFGSFMATTLTNGQCGIFFAHPRDGLQPVIAVQGLPPALGFDPAGRRGSACVAYRSSDGTLIAGERAPAGTSVDLHVMRLSGDTVVFDQLFSVGTSWSVGEIPQCGLLSDGRIVVAATDLTAGGPLAQFLTAQYHWQGLGIVDTVSGSVTPIQVANLSSFPGVINGLAVAKDEQTVYVGNWISATSGDLWAVPIQGGTATQVAQLPFGASNVAIDLDGTVLVSTLNGPDNLFRYDPVANTTTPIPTGTGPLNAVYVEPTTGYYLTATASAAQQGRSLFWMSPVGTPQLLVAPNLQTISGISANPNPEPYGASTPGSVDYRWALSPNPGGMPLVGNSAFSLTVESVGPMNGFALMTVSLAKTAPTTQFGITTHVDFGAAVTRFVPLFDVATMPLAIPNDPNFIGLQIFGQTYVSELATGQLAATPGVELTIL